MCQRVVPRRDRISAGDITVIGNESVLKIIINDNKFIFLNCNQRFSNFKPFNSFRVFPNLALFDKIASVYFI